MRKALFMFFVAALAVASQACTHGLAGAGYTGFNGISLPGYEAAGVVAGTQTQIAAIASQAIGMVPFYASGYGYGNVPVCRLQDLQGLPQVNQPVLVQVDKSKGSWTANIIGVAAVVGGIAYINSGYDWRAATAGAVTGGGGGLLWTNNKPDDLCLFLPVKAP